MKVIEIWNGVFYWKASRNLDQRGIFNKLLPKEILEFIGDFNLQDQFVTESNVGVIRGIHLQYGPFASSRLIHVLEGTIDDVLLDLRPDSKTYSKIHSKLLGDDQYDSVFVPPLVAHGFEAITQAKILYSSDKPHSASSDSGFNPLTIGYNWSNSDPILSERDINLPKFVE